MTEKETLREALVWRLKNGSPQSSEGNIGLGLVVVVLLGFVPFGVVVAICTTVYYCMKLFAR